MLSLICFQAGLKAALSCSSTKRQDKAFVAAAERDSVDMQFSKSRTQSWPLSCETVNNVMMVFFLNVEPERMFAQKNDRFPLCVIIQLFYCAIFLTVHSRLLFIFSLCC